MQGKRKRFTDKMHFKSKIIINEWKRSLNIKNLGHKIHENVECINKNLHQKITKSIDLGKPIYDNFSFK